jgi:hypothetical protein
MGSLRQAIIDTPSGGTVDFQPGLSGTITLTTGELLIEKDLTIAGPGADVITVSGNHTSRVFEIAATETATISGLTIADGRSVVGGGVFNSGILTIRDSTISGNTATTDAYPLGGGGIYSSGTLTVIGSTVSDNSTIGIAPGGGLDNGGTLNVMNSTIRDNTALQGGAIYSFSSSGSTLVVHSSIITGNTARNIGTAGGGGGGIQSDGGMVVITGSTISDNTSLQGGGGGIYFNRATAVIASSNISGNNAGFAGVGGGIYSLLSTLTLVRSTISNNTVGLVGGGTGGDGGGIFMTLGEATISNCIIKDNIAHYGGIGGEGGGVWAEAMTVTIEDSTISGNTADRLGGGIHVQDVFMGALVTITRSTINSNTAEQGGGIEISAGGPEGTTTVQLLNCTVSGNTATGTQTAGGISSFAGSSANLATQLLNCTIADNSAPGSDTGSQLFSGRFGSGYVDVEFRNTIISGDRSRPNFFAVGGGTFTSGGHNFINDGTGGSGFADTDLVGTAAFPIDPMLEPLGDYGGPTQTMRPLPGSPVINTGDNTDAPDTDQRGFPRIVLGFIDIGAVELQPDEFGPRSRETLVIAFVTPMAGSWSSVVEAPVSPVARQEVIEPLKYLDTTVRRAKDLVFGESHRAQRPVPASEWESNGSFV